MAGYEECTCKRVSKTVTSISFFVRRLLASPVHPRVLEDDATSTPGRLGRTRLPILGRREVCTFSRYESRLVRLLQREAGTSRYANVGRPPSVLLYLPLAPVRSSSVCLFRALSGMASLASRRALCFVTSLCSLEAWLEATLSVYSCAL